jgi:hypothetical protein
MRCLAWVEAVLHLEGEVRASGAELVTSLRCHPTGEEPTLIADCLRVKLCTPLFVFTLCALGSWSLAGQAPNRSLAFDAPVDQSSAVSFFWFGDMDSHFRQPMNFFVVPASDRRLHTVEIDHARHANGGWNAYMTVSETENLIAHLKHPRLLWSDSGRREVLKGSFQRANSGSMDITVLSSKGTAKAYIRIAEMCDQLALLDSAMPTRRILWQFQLLRVDDGCAVPGFNDSVVPTD